ncbi:MAG: CapA family protein [Ruminococcaceae bacterium]|nr:CapA family protein [Oscillospiraceae bacterium]
MKKTASLIITFLIIFSALFSACVGTGSDKPKDTTQAVTTSPETTKSETTLPETTSPETTESESSTEETTAEDITTEPPITKSTVTLIAVGDNLIHDSLISSGKKHGYDSFYSRIKDTVRSADVAIINQESTFTYDPSKYAGYPRFASPPAIGEAAINAGFDVFTLATNHTWDNGEQPIIDTLDFFSKHPSVMALGIHSEMKSYYQVRVIEKNGIKIAMLNCTALTNRPNSVWWRMNDMSDKDYFRQMLGWAEKNADITVVIPHWGAEYQHTPNYQQTSWAKFFTEYGADIIIGHHPHVVQPMMTVKADNGNTSLCYYSLGNFISDQTSVKKNVGGMASLTIVKENGVTRVENAALIPTTVHVERVSGTKVFQAILLSDLTPELLKKDVKFGSNTVEEFWEVFDTASKSYP